MWMSSFTIFTGCIKKLLLSFVREHTNIKKCIEGIFMVIGTYIEHFAGKKVDDWNPEVGITNPETTLYRLSVAYGEDDITWSDRFADFLNDSAVGAVTGLVAGMWIQDFGDANDSARVVEAIAAAREKLPRLTALFLGDITFEESEISWIEQTDVSPLFEAYPALEHFRVRGGNNLRLGRLHSEHLKELGIESGGLDSSVVHDVLRSDLPALEHLELWLGDANYGANTTMEDLAPLFTGQLFPNLRYLGLRDSEITNEIAQAIVQSPLLERLRVLDLSLGVLDDTGAAALLASPAVKKLEKLDIHHHYCSDQMVEQLKALGIEVDASDRQEEGEYGRYVAVSE
jgi:hypothetical protein